MDEKERRRLALLQAAAVIYAGGQRWDAEHKWMTNGHSAKTAVIEASQILEEIERREAAQEEKAKS